MNSFFRSIFLSAVICAASVSAMGQDINSLSSGNLKTLNVDELSDEQIGKLVKQFEESGYSEQQVEILARARGASETQIAKLRQRIADYKSGEGQSENIGKIDRNRDDLLSNKGTSFDPFTNLYQKKEETKVNGLPIFGLSFFKNENLTFEPSLNVPTPKDYQLGAGDQIIIDVWGASEQTYQLTISPEGSIVVPNIGPIYLNGLSIERADLRIKSRLKSIYSTLGSNTFAQISLGQIRTISVNVIGEVERPGSYEMSSFATAFNALYSAGGPNESGSLREIKIFRGGNLVSTLDAYQFLVFGEGQNTKLQDQDVVLVKPYVNRIEIAGEVKRPAIYESILGESFEQALNFAGGFNSNAYKKSVSVRRNLENRKTVETINGEQFASFVLQDGDKIDIGVIQNQFVGRIRLEGAINHPGEFELKEGMMLSEAIELADGFRADAFMNRAIIIRQNDDLSLTSVAFSPQELISGSNDVPLHSEDLIKIQSIYDLQEDFTISIRGEVQKPGEYAFVEGMTVENLIYLANGFKETATKSSVEVARRVTEDQEGSNSISELFNLPISEDLKLSSEDKLFTLMPFDLIVVRKSPYYENQVIVEVEGEVLYPGKYALNTKYDRISDIIKRAGGYTDEAYPKGGTLIRETEYFDEAQASEVKRLRIQSLGKLDSTTAEGSFSINKKEAIAIKLDEINRNPGSTIDLILKEGDVISVPKELQTIRVRGEVYFPNNLIYEKKMGFKEYLALSGGHTQDAKLTNAYVIYPNGSAKIVKNFLWFKWYPKIEQGSEIIVPGKQERRKLSPQEIIGITSGIGTIALIINNLTTK